MNKKLFTIFFLALWTEFKSDYQAWRGRKENVFEDNFEQATIHTFIKWLEWKQKQ